MSHCAGNVCAAGKGVDLCLDHHKRAPYENLFVNLDAGAGTRLWRCGGGDALGKNSGARETFWNIRARQPLSYPPPAFGPASMNLVAVQTKQPSQISPTGKWFENLSPEQLAPQDIHQAQLARRLSQKGQQASTRSDELAKGFANPPIDARLRAYWWWLNGNVTREAITRDLEEMKAKGFSGAVLVDADGASQDGNDRVPHGPTFFTPEWRELYKHTLHEADRLGLEISLKALSISRRSSVPRVCCVGRRLRVNGRFYASAAPSAITRAFPLPAKVGKASRWMCWMPAPFSVTGMRSSSRSSPMLDRWRASR